VSENLAEAGNEAWREIVDRRSIDDGSAWQDPASLRNGEAIVLIFIDRGAPLPKSVSLSIYYCRASALVASLPWGNPF
jgi:hypothetical protein